MKESHSTKQQYSGFFRVFSKLREARMYSDHHELIHEFTHGRTTSLKDLSPSEYNALIKQSFTKISESETRQKRKVIALFCQMGYKVDDKADMSRINEWCRVYGPIKRHLNAHSGRDLNKLVTQAENVYKKFIEKL